MSPLQDVSRLRKLFELSMTLSGEPMDIFVHVARMIGEFLDVKVVCLSEIRGAELHFLSVYVRGEVFTHAGGCPLDITPCATVEASRELRVYDRVAERFPEAGFLREHSAYAYCGFPSLDSSGKVIAVTCLLDDQPREFLAEDQQWLLILGQRIGLEMQRKKLIEAHDRSLQALNESEQRLGLALMGAELGLWDWDVQTGAVYYNERWSEMLGYGPRDIAPHYDSWARLVHPDDMPRVLKELKPHLAGMTPFYEVEHRLLTKEGHWKWVLARGKVLKRDSQGQPLRAAGTHMDISANKLLEERLRQKQDKLFHAQRFTLAGELSATLAHELNQPLASITNYLGAATLGFSALLAEHPGLKEIIDESLLLARHAAEVVKSFRMLARGEQRQYEWVNLGEMMDEILFFLNRELRHRRIEWVLEVPESLPWLLSQRVHLQQLFLNLILNAMDAMHTPEIPQRQLLIAARLTGEPAIAVCIGDTGPGIAPDIARRLFEPFVTSKPNGIGLGLSICRTLAEEQGGRIKVRSVAGRGTLFHVTLPVGPGTDRHGN